MKRIGKYLIVCAVMGLAACASPAAQMSPQQISSLSNQQLCDLQNNYLWDQNTEIEIGRRNLNCDPIYNECLLRGMKPDGPEMALCMNQIRETQALQAKVAQQQRELETERTLNEMRAGNQQQQNQVIVVQPGSQRKANTSPFCPTFPYCN
jgi:hypothetical protein